MKKNKQVSLRIKNFRSIKDVEIELRPNVYLFGSNGSGKSSLLKAIAFFSNYITNVLNYDLGITDPYYFLVKSALRINEYSIFNSYKDIVINNDTSKNIEFMTSVSNLKIEIRRLVNIPKSFFDNEYIVFSDNDDPLIEPIDYLYNLKDYEPKLNSNSSFIDTQQNIEYGFTNYRTSFIFSQDNNEYDLLRKIVFEDIDEGYSFSFSPVFNSTEMNPYPHLDSIFQYSVENEENKFIKDFLESQFSFLPEFNSYFKSSIRFKQIDENIVRELHSYFKRMEKVSSQNILGKLSIDEKRWLFKKILLIADKLFIHFPKHIASIFYDLFYVPSIRELPKHSYQLAGGRFSEADYMGILKRLDEDVFIPKLIEEINESVNDHFHLGEKIEIKKEELSGCINSRNIKNGALSNLSNSSSGIQQLLPIIFHLLNQDHPDSIFLCEQPELHLHPKLQTLLASFLVKKRNRTKIKILETHSEHIIRKVQTLLAKGELQKEDVIVYYFYKEEDTGVTFRKEMEIEENGFFKEPWPDGFFDDSYKLTKELLLANKN